MLCGEQDAPEAPAASGFVLAGGQSSRMGRDKALVDFVGRPLVRHALEALRAAGLPASIAGGNPALAAFAPLVQDTEKGLGPMSGICAALASTSARWAVFLPVDLPLMPASLIAFLLRHAKVTGRAITVPSINGFRQTFPAVVETAVLPVLQREFKAGRGGCFSGFRACSASRGEPVSVVPVELVGQAGQAIHPDALPPVWWFLNVNSERELHRAQALFPVPIG